MATYKYVLPRFSLQAKIERLECIKETAKFVTLIDRFDCETRRGKACHVFDTWEEAHAALTRIVEAELNTVRLRLQHLQGVAGNVRGMKPPAAEVE
jgi:hypothetical protein